MLVVFADPTILASYQSQLLPFAPLLWPPVSPLQLLPTYKHKSPMFERPCPLATHWNPKSTPPIYASLERLLLNTGAHMHANKLKSQSPYQYIPCARGRASTDINLVQYRDGSAAPRVLLILEDWKIF